MAFRQSKTVFSPLNLRNLQRSIRPAARSQSRFVFVPYVAALTFVGGLYLSTTSDQRKDLLEKLFSPLLVHADSAPGEDLRNDPKSGPAIRIDPETSMPFPHSLPLASTSSPLTLIGLGPRKVSFLRVKVYSAGFYLEDSALDTLRDVEGWHSFTSQHLLVPPTTPSSSKGDVGAPQLSGEALMRNLLNRPVACAVRIVPVKNTDFGHLRDGFTRALLARQKLARVDGSLSEADEERIATSLQQLKALFPSQTVPKGKSLVLVRPKQGGLVVEYDGKVLGRVDDPWIGREMMLAYFADKNVISDALKEDVAKGFDQYLTRRKVKVPGWS